MLKLQLPPSSVLYTLPAFSSHSVFGNTKHLQFSKSLGFCFFLFSFVPSDLWIFPWYSSRVSHPVHRQCWKCLTPQIPDQVTHSVPFWSFFLDWVTFKGPSQHKLSQEFLGRRMELRLFCTSKLILLLLLLKQCQKFGKDPAVLRIYWPFSNIYHYSFFGAAFSIWNICFLLKLPFFLCSLFLSPISGATSSLPSLRVLVTHSTSLVAHGKHGKTIPKQLKGILGTF